MRKHVIFLLLALSVASMQAQEFQWAKGWTSGDNISGVPSNTIVKSLFDREGNIYILGTFGYGATLDGVELLPMPDPDSLTYSQRQFYMTDVKSTLIAKLSPEGHLLWHKVIKYTNGAAQGAYPQWMQLVGDSTLVVQTDLHVPFASGQGLWYLDTLLIGSNNPSQNPTYPVSSGRYTAMLTFDLSGNKVDEHFLSLQRHRDYFGWITPSYVPSFFNVDDLGNIYMIAQMAWSDEYDSMYLSVDEIRQYPMDDFFLINDSVTSMYQRKILKFSPDYELLWQKNLIDSATIHDPENMDFFTLDCNGFSVDNNNNMYLTSYITRYSTTDSSFYETLHLNNGHDFVVSGEECTGAGFVVKIDTAGDVQWLSQLYRDETANRYAMFYYPQCIAVNNDSNSAVILWSTELFRCDSSNALFFDSSLSIRVEDSIPTQWMFTDVKKQLSTFEKIDLTTGQYLSQGTAKSGGTVQDGPNGSEIIYQNNQILFQIRCTYNIIGVDTVYNFGGFYNSKIALFRFKDDGTLLSMKLFDSPDDNLAFMGYYSRAIINPNGDVLLTGCFSGDMGFDSSTSLHGASGCSNVYIALFNDTTLLHPWGVQPNDTADTNHVNIVGIENGDIYVYPNPASDIIIVKAAKDISDMVLYNVKGEAVLVKRGSSLNGQSVIEINGLNDGIYFLKIVTSDGTSTKKIIKK